MFGNVFQNQGEGEETMNTRRCTLHDMSLFVQRLGFTMAFGSALTFWSIFLQAYMNHGVLLVTIDEYGEAFPELLLVLVFVPVSIAGFVLMVLGIMPLGWFRRVHMKKEG
jgi:hypothetical protein